MEPIAAVAAARRDPGLAVLEGFHAVKHAIRFGADLIHILTPDPARLAALAADLASDVAPILGAATAVTPEEFADLAPHPIPTPALAVARRPRIDAADVAAAPGYLVLLDRPNHLGNIGAVVRVAAAAGAAGVLTTGERDPWDPAALRGSAGLHYAVPVARIDSLPATARPVVAVHPEGSPLGAAAIPSDAVLAFGSERSGLSAAVLERAEHRIAIPMRPGVSSLNLATSVAVVLYAGG